MQSEKMNPRLLITFTVMLLSQSVLLAVSPLVTDDADTVEAGKLQLNCDFQFVRTSSTSLYLDTDQSGLGLDSSSRARRNIRLSVARWFRVDPDQRRCRRSNGPDDRAQVSTLAGPRGQAEVQRAHGPETADRVRPARARHRKLGHRHCGNRDLHHREDEPGL